MSNLNESRSQVKRKYGEYNQIRVNEKAPIRNSIINFVGKRFVTETELKNHLTKVTEERGKDFDQRKWFGNNKKYFEAFENRGQRVWTLSKYGQRVHEFINKPKNTNNVNESKGTGIGLFKAAILESVNPFEAEYKKLNMFEGALAKKGAKDLEDMNLQVMIDDAEPDFAQVFQNYCDKLGQDPSNVIQVDSESHEDDPLMNKIYKYLDSHFRGTETIAKDSPGSFAQFDPKLNVVRADDYGFVGFYFTADSNF